MCYQWQEKESKNKCSLPTLRDIWTIHGIWPTKLRTEGPNFCNKTWHFDPNQLFPFEQQLMIYWLNIEKNTPLYSLWKHEWIKHGTCAASIPDLDNEAKYFKCGLDWIGKYDMKSVLAKGGVVPNQSQGYKAEDIFYAVKSVLKKNPTVECVTDKKTGKLFINEIRICFDKNLTLIDCDGIKHPKLHVPGPIITNCDPSKTILYPDVVPTHPNADPCEPCAALESRIPWQLNLYRLLQFLIWFTL